MGFCLVVLGIFIYNLKHPVEKKFKERGQERRRERSIERLFSVATTKVWWIVCVTVCCTHVESVPTCHVPG